MKKNLCLVLTGIMFGCTAPPSSETVSADTVRVDTTLATAQPVAVTMAPEPPALVISDSSARALSDLVNAQFEAVALALADSANYYQVRLEDYFDEYEGLAEMTQTTWFFDKEFAIVYAKHSYENGAMDKPDVVEYILKNNTIVCTREDSDYTEVVQARSSIIWDAQAGGVQLNYATYDKRIESKKELADVYASATRSTLELDFSTMETMLDLEGYTPPEGEEMYTIRKEVPKEPQLLDYTMVIIPKAVYDKLRSNDD